MDAFLEYTEDINSFKGEKMMKKNNKPIIAKALASLAKSTMISAANSKCMFVYHQPKQPELKKFRKF